MTSLIRSVFSIFSGKFAGIVISLAFTPILVRIISQPEYGLFASMFAVFSIVTLLSKGGLFDATRKIVAEHSDDSQAVSSVISTAVTISVIYAIVATVSIVLIIQTDLVPARYVPYVWILAATIIFANIFTTVRGTFYGFQRESIGEVLQVSRKLLYTSSALVLAYAGFKVVGVFSGYALSFLLLSLVGLIVLSRNYSFSVAGLSDFREYGREIAVYGGFQLIGGLSATLLYKVDILLIETFEGNASTALYQSAIVPAEMIWFVPSVIQLAFLQRSAKLWENDNIEGINNNIKTGVKYGILSLTLFGSGLFILARPFLSVYFGVEYTDATSTLRLLIFGTFFLGISRTVVPVLQATGFVRESELVTFVGLLVNVVLNVMLIPRYGIFGAGIGTTVSYFMIFLGNVSIWVRSPFKLVPFRWVARLVFFQTLFVSIFAAIVYSITFRPLIALVVFPPVGFMLFMGVNLYGGYIPRSRIKNQVQAGVNYLQ
ncbi:flippase [Natrinema sp. J7-2]|uniref:flippase n=1 Tax=Natrinema sp. (strain J7-2) TaxID=406552 RepID=UPI000A044265|nr:flippase [Natrinema sp. J7-2]